MFLKRDGLSARWTLFRQGDLSAQDGHALIRVVFQEGGLALMRVVFRQGTLTHQDGLSSE